MHASSGACSTTGMRKIDAGRISPPCIFHRPDGPRTYCTHALLAERHAAPCRLPRILLPCRLPCSSALRGAWLWDVDPPDASPITSDAGREVMPPPPLMSTQIMQAAMQHMQHHAGCHAAPCWGTRGFRPSADAPQSAITRDAEKGLHDPPPPSSSVDLTRR